MALSGSFSVGVSSHWDLICEWTADQDIGGNSSKVTARLYWKADGYGAIYSGQSNTVGIRINGGSYDTASASPALSNGQKKQIHSHTVNVPHNSDGTKTFTIDAYFNMEVSLNGTYYPSKSLSNSPTLNTIPRESSLVDTTPNWTAGGNVTISIKRYTSAFKHEVQMYLEESGGYYTAPDDRKYTHLKEILYSTSETSKSTSFTTAEHYKIFQKLKGEATVRCWIRLSTFNGGTRIGTNDYYCTVTAPSASTAVQNNFTLGGTREISISRNNSSFKHEIKVSIGSWSKVLDTDAGTSVTWNTATDMSAIMGQISATSKTGTMTLTTTTNYYNGTSKQIVREPRTDTFVVTIPTSQSPSFTGAVTWTDSNPTLNTLKGTGNNAIMIQGASTLVVTLPSNALGSAKTGTTMKNYSVTLGTVTKSVNHPTTASNLTFTFASKELNFSSNQTIKVIAYDKRGFSTTVNKTVSFVPYKQPSMIMKAIRDDGFGNMSTIGVSGVISPIAIGGSNKNSLVSVQYRYKQNKEDDTKYTPLVSMTSATGTTYPSYKMVDVSGLDLLNEKAWIIEFQVKDGVGTHKGTIALNVGRPIFYIDPDLSSLGFNAIPTLPDSFQVGGTIHLPTSRWAERGAGIDMHNSDIVGVNQIFTSDEATSDAEGWHFARDNTPSGSTTHADYDTFRIQNGTCYLNSIPMYSVDKNPIFAGSTGLDNGDTIMFNKNVNNVPNGIILVWSRAGAYTDWTTSVVMKKVLLAQESQPWTFTIGLYGGGAGVKICYIHANKMTGHAKNVVSPNSTAVLRYVYEF